VRTTIRLEDELLQQAKALAARSGRTLTRVIEDALREAIGRLEEGVGVSPPSIPIYGDGGVQPGVDLDSSAALLDLMGESSRLDPG
jgi:hypothetical protein